MTLTHFCLTAMHREALHGLQTAAANNDVVVRRGCKPAGLRAVNETADCPARPGHSTSLFCHPTLPLLKMTREEDGEDEKNLVFKTLKSARACSCLN